MVRPVTVYPAGGVDQAQLPWLPIQDRPHTRDRGIVGRCAAFPQQLAFIQAPYRNTLFCGGSGSGKTAAAAYKFIHHGLAITNGIGPVVAKDRNMLRTVQWRAINDLLDWWAKVNGFSFVRTRSYHDLTITLINGFEIRFRPADDADKFIGVNADIVWADEVSVWPDQINLFQKLQARLRGSRFGTSQRFIASTTPKGPYGIVGLFAQECTLEIRPDAWVSSTPRAKTATEGWCMIFGSTADNLNYDPSYVEAIRQTMSEELAAQETEGKIVNVSGTVYARYFHHRDSIIDWHYQPDRHEVHCCIDWGFNRPYAAFIGHDPEARAGVAERPEDCVFAEYTRDRVSGHREIFTWIRETQARFRVPFISAFHPDPDGREEIKALRREFPKAKVNAFTRTDDRATRWGVDVLCSRLLSADGRRHYFVSKELARQDQNTNPRGRGVARMFLGLAWEERRGAEAVFRDKVKDDEFLINCADAHRYYASHQYREIGRGIYLV